MIGSTTRDSRPRAWKPELSATTRRRSRPIASQSQAILGERSAQRHRRAPEEEAALVKIGILRHDRQAFPGGV